MFGKIIRIKPEKNWKCVCGNDTFYDEGTGADGFATVWINGSCTKCWKPWELDFEYGDFDRLRTKEENEAFVRYMADQQRASFALEGIKVPDRVYQQMVDFALKVTIEDGKFVPY